ncbi:MAG TPA: hypothetical protein VM406_15050 [Noviherbaspirillum sp.]|nr:hypothetical protein [Noviherbaspirillum sp.]
MKRLEILGALGAGVIGAGLGILFADRLETFAIPALLFGIAVHGWAMFQKGRVQDREEQAQPGWATATEWICWVLLAALALYIGLQLLA